ncbi:hypothetical protein RF11_04523 [Thelohanellus kitauei]|uniref:Uncharacterized protein n=1 Tax=Thelohanellus kitauei TaxID=669202 RepID=A0A0C2MU16_THEKT|nr:hypothetical protein RF11_04523 [Thelohanellus kitauei]
MTASITEDFLENEYFMIIIFCGDILKESNHAPCLQLRFIHLQENGNMWFQSITAPRSSSFKRTTSTTSILVYKTSFDNKIPGFIIRKNNFGNNLIIIEYRQIMSNTGFYLQTRTCGISKSEIGHSKYESIETAPTKLPIFHNYPNFFDSKL